MFENINVIKAFKLICQVLKLKNQNIKGQARIEKEENWLLITDIGDY